MEGRAHKTKHKAVRPILAPVQGEIANLRFAYAETKPSGVTQDKHPLTHQRMFSFA
jgi:hypothetical protein